MNRIGNNGGDDARPTRAAGLALTLSLHAGVAAAAWVGLAQPPSTDPVPIAVRFVEVASADVAAAPAVEPEPAALPPPEPLPEPVPMPEPAPLVEPPPVVEPTPVAVPEPVVEPAPVVEPEPMVEPAPVAETPPVTEPTPVEPPPPQLVADSSPRADAVQTPPRPRATPKRKSRPAPKPRPEPKAEPAPVVQQRPVDAVPVREPDPAPAPTPAPVARATPVPPAPPPSPAPTQTARAPVSSEPAAEPFIEPRYNAAYLRNPAPAYPRLSRRLGEHGRVVLRVRVEPDGRPSELEVQRSSGSLRLDKAALDAVRRWSFVAARRGDRNIAAWVLVPMEFRLNGG